MLFAGWEVIYYIIWNAFPMGNPQGESIGVSIYIENPKGEYIICCCIFFHGVPEADPR
jgi:hypothetical protein